MLYNIFYPYAEQFQILNLLKYITFRSGAAIMTALLICFVVGPFFIRWLRKKQPSGQPIRHDGPPSHIIEKAGTPTMGGALILLSLFVTTLLWADLTNAYVWIILFVTLSFGTLGFVDDYLKLMKKNSAGVPGKVKLLVQASLSLIAIMLIIFYHPKELETGITIPFVKEFIFDLGLFFFPFALCVIIGTSNAVNLTDGLDGLAIFPCIIVAGCFAIFAYVGGHYTFSKYLHIPFIQGTGELAIFCGAFIGAGLGFLWFNAPPASVFMGDTGSLSLGGAIGTMSVITKQELVLPIIGGIFVLEAVSVILQVTSFKLTGKRIFKMAPIHHHFEHRGWTESTIVIRFWIIAVILALIGLSTLKIR